MAENCKGTTKAGDPCRSTSVRANGYCFAHQPEEVRRSHGFGGAQEGAGRPRLPRPHERMRERIEEEIEAIVGPYFAALEGAVIHGTYEGEVFVSEHADHGARIAAAEKLLDRVYGKPRQQLEHTGADGGPIEHAEAPALDDESLELIRELRRRRVRPS